MSDRIVFSCDRAEIEGLLDRSADLLQPAVEDLLYRMLDEEPVEWKESNVGYTNSLDGRPGIIQRWTTLIGGYLVVVRDQPEGNRFFWYVTGESDSPFNVSAQNALDSLEHAKSDAVKATRALVAVFGPADE